MIGGGFYLLSGVSRKTATEPVTTLTHRRPLRKGISYRFDRYSPVLALTLLRRRAAGMQILVGVRTPVANKTHALVASVPTMRVPTALATVWSDRRLRKHHIRPADHPELAYAVSHILSRKLGMADHLELEQLRFEIRQIGAWQGTSVIGETLGEPRTEDLTMFNACVVLTDGDDQFPEATASYSPIVWADVSDFLQMTQNRDVGALKAGLDEVLVCVYGLCLQTTEHMLTHLSSCGLLGQQVEGLMKP